MVSIIQHVQKEVYNLMLLPQEGRKRVECPALWLFSGLSGDWYLTQVLTGSWYTVDA